MAIALRRVLGVACFSERFSPATVSRHLSAHCAAKHLNPVAAAPSADLLNVKFGGNDGLPPFYRVSLFSNLLDHSPLEDRRAPPQLYNGKQKKFDLPTNFTIVNLEMPTLKSYLNNIQIIPNKIEIEAPQKGQVEEKRAHRMIVIRKRKMKKHQLKKFRKKFRVLLLKKKAKRNSEKETVFLAEVVGMLLKAEAFNPKDYVDRKLEKAYEPLPKKEKLVKPLPWEFQPLFHMSKTRKE